MEEQLANQQPQMPPVQAPVAVLETPNEMPPQTPKKGLHIKTLVLIFILTLAALGLTMMAIMNKPNNSPTAQVTATPTPALANPVQTTLTVSSSPVRLSTPSAFSTDIVINTGQDLVNKVQLELSYDPKVLTKVDINPGTFFTNPQILLKTLDPTNGRISFALGVQNGQSGILGQGVIATLNFSLVANAASASVSLLPKTQVTADGYSVSVLKSTANGIFNDLNKIPLASRSATLTP